MNNDIFYNIIEINFHAIDMIKVRGVSKDWRNTINEILILKYNDLVYIFTKIAENQVYDLSFEYCYRLIYNHCLQKTECVVLLIASHIFKSYDLDIGQAISVSKLFSDICLYLNKLRCNFFRRKNIFFPRYAFRFSFVRVKKKNRRKKRM